MHNNEQASTLLDEKTQSLLSAVGNHEAKSLAASVINAQPDRQFSIRQLEAEMVSRQGDEPAWCINSGTLADYCVSTLHPVGVVARDEEHFGSRTRQVFYSTEFGENEGLSFAGAVLEWSLEYPKNSVQQLLGITAVAGESMRAPVMSYLLMQELMTSPEGKEKSVAAIGRSLGEGMDSSRVIEEHLHRLEGEGYVELRTAVQDYNPIYRINREEARDIRLTNDTSIAIREAWLDNPEDEMSLSQLLETMRIKYPDLPQTDIRRVMAYVTPRQRLPFLEITNKNGTPIRLSSATVTSMGKLLMGHFVEAVEASLQDEGQRYGQFAAAIVASPEKFKLLMEKSKQASNSASPGLSRDIVLSEIRDSGEVSVSTLRESLALKGHKVGKASVRRYLTALLEESLVLAESKPLSKDLKRKATYYRIAD